RGGVAGWPRDLFLDDKPIIRQGIAGEGDRIERDFYKEINFFLTGGQHRLRIRRLGFPGVLPSKWELRASRENPAACITARFQGYNIVRVGEKIHLAVTGGTTTPTSYDLVSINTITPGETALATVAFPATGKAMTKILDIPCQAEGVFEVRARVAGKLLRPNDLHIGCYTVIDTKHTAALPKTMKKTLIHDIDCVKQTDMGKPIANGDGFWETTEPTRVVTTSAGTYREGGDNTDPKLPYPPGAPSWRKYNSGFAYAVNVPTPQQLYLLEVDYPDDDRRTTNIFVVEPEKAMPCQLYGGYECGDWFTLSNKMQTDQVLFWARGTKVSAAVLSKNPGMRAAAARIRVYQVDALPDGPPSRPDGRLLTHWMEEPTRWLQHGVPPANIDSMAQNFIAIDRYVRLCRYNGFNAVSPTEAIYQGTTYLTDELEGWFEQPYDSVRIVALMCEKYGMRYIPEIHLSDQAWFRSEVVEKLAPNSDDLYLYSRLGTNAKSGGSWFSATWNPLHPAIEAKYLRIIGELTDKIGDSPAFAGVSCRLMSWVWQGWNGLPSLNWGYGDWDIAQFTKDTGIVVPGKAGDPERFQQRFAFLTSETMLPKWMAWRNGRMLAYYRAIRDRIRKSRPDAVFYLPYYGDAKQGMDLTFGSFFGTEEGALREVGIDLDAMAKEPGICVLPSGMYGRRDLGNVIADAGVSDSIADPERKRLGFAYERAFGFGNAYFEDQAQVHVGALGISELPDAKGNNGAAEGAGRHVLEKLAYALADGDSGMLRQGGMGYTFGRPAEYGEFLAEYEQLPKLPFTALDAARDPVAVWYRDCA
ncbi:MAG TPA: hypothetical protein VGM23_02690, partial [Armatimonadota bacterium]